MARRLRCRASIPAERAGTYQCWNPAKTTMEDWNHEEYPVCGVHARQRVLWVYRQNKALWGEPEVKEYLDD